VDTSTISRVRPGESWFRFSEAMASGLTRSELRRSEENGLISKIARGIYIHPDEFLVEPDLVAATAARPLATLCLTSALARHGLIDDNPSKIDVAVPRGTRIPKQENTIRWHTFDTSTFLIGREELLLAPGLNIGIYSAERCIVDAFRLRGIAGRDIANQALKYWLRMGGAQPSILLRMASQFPRSIGPLRTALEILL